MGVPIVLTEGEGEQLRARPHYFRELEARWSGDAPPARAEELELMRRHGMDPVE
ncbi:MAG TPA: hypothetical protein VE664_09940 [Actinomycetes bacterium]|jgi:hypothetical protein|nr:hypothetical protein [Actinomycetes bacterium]